MKRVSSSVVIALLCAALLAVSPTPRSAAAETIDRPNRYEAIAPGVWLHTSYKDLGSGVPFPSNGLLVRAGDELVLVDTAWTDAKTVAVLDWARSELGMEVARAIVTHAHDDKMGGVAALHERGIPTLAGELTNRLAPQRGLEPAHRSLELGEPREIAEGVEAYFPGPGHTADNIVVYLAAGNILFGGCLVRPAGSSSLGYTADADLDQWAETIEGVRDRFGEAEIVVPSHGAPGDRRLLDHTIALAREADTAVDDEP